MAVVENVQAGPKHKRAKLKSNQTMTRLEASWQTRCWLF